MEKKNFITLVFGVIGGLLFSLGMCMIMVYNMMFYGIIVGVVGILLLLFLIPMCLGLKDSKKEEVIEENQFDSNEIYYKCLQDFIDCKQSITGRCQGIGTSPSH